MEDNEDIRIREICSWDKRRKCDSLYIDENNKLKKKIHKVLEVVDKCNDEKLKGKIKKILENI